MYQIRAENRITYNHRSNNFQDLELVDSFPAESDRDARDRLDEWLSGDQWLKYWLEQNRQGQESETIEVFTLRLFNDKGELVKTSMLLG